MSYREFAYMLSGLGPETPLGRIVAIRAEDDPEVLKTFTKDQKRIRNEYKTKQAKAMPKQQVENALEVFKQAFIKMAGGANNAKA